MPAPITVINPATVYVPPTFSYSHAVCFGDLVFVAGQVAQNARGELVGKDDPRQQTEQVSFAKTPSGEQVVDLSALIRRRS